MAAVIRTTPLPCIVCKVQLEASIGEWTQPSGGVTLADYAAYGSKFDDEAIMLTVCDDCLAANRDIVLSFRKARPKTIMEYETFAEWLDRGTA